MFIGLLCGVNEPNPSSGYARIEGYLTQTLAFNPSSGYGMVTHIALYDEADGGAPLKTIELPEPVDVHAGVIPIIHEGRLLRGVDVTAHILTATKGQSNL